MLYAKDPNAPSGASTAAPVIRLWGLVQHRTKMAPISTQNGTNLDHAGGKGYTKINTNMKQLRKNTNANTKMRTYAFVFMWGIFQKSDGATAGRLPMFYNKKWQTCNRKHSTTKRIENRKWANLHPKNDLLKIIWSQRHSNYRGFVKARVRDNVEFPVCVFLHLGFILFLLKISVKMT